VASAPGACRGGAGFAVHTLGCPKNEADSATLERRLAALGHRPVSIAVADLVIVNTCGFIDAAKEESIDAILEVAESCHARGARIAAIGCLVERYGEELRREIPEVDVWSGFDDAPLMRALAALAGEIEGGARSGGGERWDAAQSARRPTVPLHAYVKISDGCDRRCAYCAIPLIKGGYAALAPQAILSAAAHATASGARELVLVGQDTSHWAWPGYGALPRLLRDVVSLEPFWLRVLYLQPDGIDGPLLEALAAYAVPYVDLPLQHASRAVLERMGRRGDADRYLALLDHVRCALPGAAVRSTFIVGFPGETERDVEALAEFIAAAELAVAGVFVFDPQEGTPALSLRPTVPYTEALERAAFIGEQIERAAARFWSAMVGRRAEVLIEHGTRTAGGRATGRIRLQAPDVDGTTTVAVQGAVRKGQIVTAVVDGVAGYHLTVHGVAKQGESEAGRT